MFKKWFFDINKEKKAMKKILFLLIFLFPMFVSAQTTEPDTIFKAEVFEIIEERSAVRKNGADLFQQNLKLRGLEGQRENEEYVFTGINDFELIKSNVYKIGDKVLLLESMGADNDPQYYIVDYVRTNIILYLFALFVFILLIVGRAKGFRSILSLFFTFLIIIKYIIPSILAGANPLVTTLLGSLVILFIIIYLTEGFNPMSHLAVISIGISLFISVFLSWFFVLAGKLSGVFSEEIASLASIGDVAINFQGLLLAGIIIGLLGVLDDVVVAQVSTVEQIHKTNTQQSRKDLFSSSFKVGISHISSMTNTLFLAYAGASLPLLVLLVSGESVFGNTFDAINNEQIATEIVRTLAGSIGLILSVPISTYLSVYWYKRKS